MSSEAKYFSVNTRDIAFSHSFKTSLPVDLNPCFMKFLHYLKIVILNRSKKKPANFSQSVIINFFFLKSSVDGTLP